MRRRALAAPALLFVALLAGGCSVVPTTGRVLSGSAGHAQQPADDPYVRVIPVGPEPGWEPLTIVKAFRTASSSFDGPNGDHQVAREYLTCGRCWRPTVASIVYGHLDSPTVETKGDGQATVTVTGTQLGRIGADGQYIADARRFNQPFHLRRNAQKQWRITDPPAELLLSRDDVNRAFRTLNLYFFAPDAQTLVPNPVFIPMVSRPWLSAQLVRQLIGGPTTWLKNAAVRSAFPAGTRLLKMTVDNGVADVDLGRRARKGDLRNMSIQLMWTLSQLPSVERMRLRIEGKPVDVPGVDRALQATRDWAAFDPNGSAGRQPAYVRTSAGRLDRLDDTGPQPIQPRVQVHHPAISYDHRQVASLDAAGDQVTVTDLVNGANRATLSATMKGGRFTTPSWDRRGNVWVVESGADGSQLWVIYGGTRKVAVNGWTLSQYPVKALRVARDGTRVAAIVQVGHDSQIQLGRIDRAPSSGLQAEGFIAISSELQSALDLAWSATDHLAVVGVMQGNPSPLLYDVPVSGGSIQPMIGPGGDMSDIASYPGAPLLVTTQASDSKSPHVCRRSDRYDEWKCFNGTSDAAYPG